MKESRCHQADNRCAVLIKFANCLEFQWTWESDAALSRGGRVSRRDIHQRPLLSGSHPSSGAMISRSNSSPNRIPSGSTLCGGRTGLYGVPDRHQNSQNIRSTRVCSSRSGGASIRKALTPLRLILLGHVELQRCQSITRIADRRFH